MPLSEAQIQEAMKGAVAHYTSNLVRVKDVGGVLTQLASGRVRLDFAVGGDMLEGVKEFQKAYLANDKWVSALLANKDPFIVKAQLTHAIEAAVADLPL